MINIFKAYGFLILVIEYVQEIDNRVGATELIIKLKTKSCRKVKFCKCFLWKCRRLVVKAIWLLSIFGMILKAVLFVQHVCSLCAMLLIVNLLIKIDSTVSCVPCMLEHVCYEHSHVSPL